MPIFAIGVLGENTRRELRMTEDMTLTAGGYEPDWLAMLRDPDGEVIAFLDIDGWHDKGGHRWDDIVLATEEPDLVEMIEYLGNLIPKGGTTDDVRVVMDFDS